jgi:Delta24-sterol reductase
MGVYTFSRPRIPFNRFTRWILNHEMKTWSLYRRLYSSDRAQKYMIQDIVMPSKVTEEFLSYANSTFSTYPLWLCPIRSDSTVPMHHI